MRSDLLNSKKREGSTITSNAKREAERLVLTATTEVSEYRNWLAGVISEAERLYRIQTQSLHSAEQAIIETKAKLTHAFDRLAGLQTSIDSSLSDDNRPIKESLGASRSSSRSKKKAPKKRR